MKSFTYHKTFLILYRFIIVGGKYTMKKAHYFYDFQVQHANGLYLNGDIIALLIECGKITPSAFNRKGQALYLESEVIKVATSLPIEIIREAISNTK